MRLGNPSPIYRSLSDLRPETPQKSERKVLSCDTPDQLQGARTPEPQIQTEKLVPRARPQTP